MYRWLKEARGLRLLTGISAGDVDSYISYLLLCNKIVPKFSSLKQHTCIISPGSEGWESWSSWAERLWLRVSTTVVKTAGRAENTRRPHRSWGIWFQGGSLTWLLAGSPSPSAQGLLCMHSCSSVLTAGHLVRPGVSIPETERKKERAQEDQDAFCVLMSEISHLRVGELVPPSERMEFQKICERILKPLQGYCPLHCPATRWAVRVSSLTPLGKILTLSVSSLTVLASCAL